MSKNNLFTLKAKFSPKGDQPKAIPSLLEGLHGNKHQVLLGVTGSGKTFTIANVIEKTQLPTLVLAHNKTLAAQLYQELKDFFPSNAVEYFVSYYDYYQPEAYVASTDTYIEKDSQINDAIDKMRHRATCSLLSRKDVIIVSSVSCIYGIGSTQSYKEMSISIAINQSINRESFLRKLVESQYQRNDINFCRGSFRVRGDTIDIFPPHEENIAFRVSLWDNEVDKISKINSLTGKSLGNIDNLTIWPASHYATSTQRLKNATASIRKELDLVLPKMKAKNLLVEAQRLEQRTLFDLEMLETVGSCKGIENYSRHLTGASPGNPPPTLLDYFPKEFLFIADESHQSIPQVRGMYNGDRSRKQNLVTHGFRLPSALDNRPLRFDEFEKMLDKSIYVSATPGAYEIDKSQGVIVEQLIRPTGLVDPIVIIKPIANQVEDVIHQCKIRAKKNQRVLITTLTKRLSEDLADYLLDAGVKAKYLHSDIDTIERMELIRALRLGEYDVLVGINLLREGLDLPEVSLVAILDADKEGFLRSSTGLIQTIGRAARNIEGMAILYADNITNSIDITLKETNRRRQIQEDYNKKHKITPKNIVKKIHQLDEELQKKDKLVNKNNINQLESKILSKIKPGTLNVDKLEKEIAKLRKQMQTMAAKMEFEKAAQIRDLIYKLEKQILL